MTAAAEPTSTVQCGDCLQLLARLPDGCAQLVLTDPPYGISYSSRRNETVRNDDGPFVWWLREAWRVAADPAVLVSFCRWDVAEAFRQSITWAGWRVTSQLVWDKGVPGMGDLKASLSPYHEMAWFAVKGRWSFPDGRMPSVLRIRGVPPRHRTHPCEKPAPLAERIIAQTTRPGNLVLDPFCGTGWVGVAAGHLGRSFHGMELEKHYAYVARKRSRIARSEGQRDDGRSA